MPQLGILDGDRLIDGGMSGDIGRVVRESAKGEGVFVDILAFEQQLAHEVAAADVVHQAAEFRAAEGVVPEVLDDGAAIGVGMGLGDLVLPIVRDSAASRRGRIWSAQSKSTISSWVRTEYADELPLHISTRRRTVAARRARSHQPPSLAPDEIAGRGMAQMRPRTTRMTTMMMTKPRPPVGA